MVKSNDAKKSPYLVRQWEAMPQLPKRQSKRGRKLKEREKERRKHLKKLRPPSYLWEIPFEKNKYGKSCLTQSLYDLNNPCYMHYKAYAELYGFAFNSAGIWSCRCGGSKFMFYGVGFDFYKVKDHLINKLLKDNEAPKKIQLMYDKNNRNIDKLEIKEVKHISPFLKKSSNGPNLIMPFQDYIKLLNTCRNGYALKHVMWLTRDCRLLYRYIKKWQDQAKLATKAYMNRLNEAALTIQLAWRRKKGSMVLHMKRRLRAEELEMEKAAIKIQLAWRRRDAKNLVKHMKLRRQREEEEENKAALVIQLAYRRRKGKMALHMKRRLKAELEQQERAAILIQNSWRRRDAKMMVKNMKARRLREIEEENRAALTIQLAWRRRKGKMALHMKRRLKAMEREQRAKEKNATYFLQYWFRKMLGTLHIHLHKIAKRFYDEWMYELNSAACYIQYIYRRHKGIVSYHILRIARKQAEEYQRERERAATYIQYIYRKKTGKLAEHLKRQARKRVQKRQRRLNETMRFANTEWKPDFWAEQLSNIVGENIFESHQQTYDTNIWEACWDNDTSRIYFYNRITQTSQWEEPSVI